MKTYNEFINEQNQTPVSIQDIYNALKEIFANDDVFSTDSVYDNRQRLIISISKLFSKDEVVIFTKLMFNTDGKKMYLTSNSFKYLYEINCQFSQEQSFTDINDFKSKIEEIISSNKFGQDLKILSEFIKKPEHTINEWFYDNKVSNISITGFEYKPEMKNVPCESLDFKFEMTVNDQDKVELVLKKLGIGKFQYTFNIFDKKQNVEKPNMSTLVQTIGETIKNSYKKK